MDNKSNNEYVFGSALQGCDFNLAKTITMLNKLIKKIVTLKGIFYKLISGHDTILETPIETENYLRSDSNSFVSISPQSRQSVSIPTECKHG